MKLQKYDNLRRLKVTYKKESRREVVRQLMINTLIEYDKQNKTCYLSDLIREVKKDKSMKLTNRQIVTELVNEELAQMSGLVVFIKETQAENTRIMLVPTKRFYASMNTITLPNITHVRASKYIENYLDKLQEKTA